MNETDLSDEAFWSCTDGMTRLQAWQECRRRATAQVSEWMIANHWATGHGDDIPDLLKELTWQIKEQLEKEIREAFEAGFSKALYGTNGIDRDEAYRAFLQQRD